MLLSRERLTSLLSEQALTSVELVIAPPGYGKTTVLREYAAGDADAVFVSLPERTDLETFVRAIVEAAVPGALRSIGGVFDGRTGTALEEYAGHWLVSRLRGFGGTVIIDDFHRAAADDRVARVLCAVIAATHGRMHWLIASRETPAFPMGSWIARGWMGLPVTGEDLRFTCADAIALAAALGIEASAADVSAIVGDTLGWPIGVRLALGLVLRKRPAGQTRMQTRAALFALIDDEVWQPLGPDLQRFIAAAVLIPAPAVTTLRQAGFPAARALASDAFARVPFVQPIDGDAFAIHDLFREFVAAQAVETRTDVASQIGTVLVAEGNVADGLQLLTGAGRHSDVEAALAEHAFELLETGQRQAVNAAIAFLDDRGLSDGGVSLAVRGAFALADGSAANAGNLYERALQRGIPDRMHGEIARRLTINYLNRGMIKDAAGALGKLEVQSGTRPADALENRATGLMVASRAHHDERGTIGDSIDRLERELAEASPQVQVRILHAIGYAASFAGDLERAERLAIDAALLATDLGMDRYAALAYVRLYSLAGMADADTKRARSFLHSLLAAAERAGDTSLTVYALRAEYAIAATNADHDRAEAFETSLAGMPDARAYRDTFGFRYSRALHLISTGEYGSAEALLKSLGPELSPSERGVRDALVIILDLLRERRTIAARALDRGFLADVSHDFWASVEMTRAFALRGIAFWALDRPAQARKSFEFDIDGLPQRDRILASALRALSELPHPVSSCRDIDALCATLERADFGAYAIALRALVGLDANDVELSAAEIETLRVFDRVGGSAADVAQILGKSRYTIQNQVQSAIRKLGCSGRAEALAYARKRGWLDKTS